MIKTLKFLFLITTISALCWSCGGSSSENNSEEYTEEEIEDEQSMEEKIKENPAAAMKEAMKEMTKAVEESGMNKVEPVDFRVLKDLLPDEVAGIDKTKSEGEKSGAMGIKMSKAEAKYEGDDKKIDITITDMGFMSAGGLGGFMSAGWLMAEVDRESDTEYEKTTTINGYKGFEKYHFDNKRGEISVMVAERFLVQITGRNVSMDDLKDALDDIDLDELEDMKDEGIE
ncbi:MAG: hypothetical protein CMO01_25330 [Thalassobius sp.]|nr:hypothetical protein [Thalassovita sp.]